MYFLADVCETSTVLKVFYFIIQLIKIACILIPTGLLLMMSFDFFKNLLTSEESEMQKNTKLVFKRVLYCVIVFAIPTIVNLTVKILNSADVKLIYNTCISNATIEKIKAFEAKEKAEKKEIEYTPNTPTDKTSGRTINKSDNSNNKKSNNTDDDDSNTAITSQGAQRILDYAEKRYKKMEKDGDWKWGRSGHHRITCCKFVSYVLIDAGYLKKKYLCHYGSPSNPMGKKKLKNMKVYSHKKVRDLKPGDVAIFIPGGRSGNIAIFSHKKNGKYYFYGASQTPEVNAKNHPRKSTYWNNKSFTIVRATK